MTHYFTEWEREQVEARNRMAQTSLYHEESEHSSCGVGLVVSLDGKPSRKERIQATREDAL